MTLKGRLLTTETSLGCSRCESLPAPPNPTGRLHLWFPLGHTTGKVVPFLTSMAVPHELRLAEGCIVVPLTVDDREAVLQGIGQLLSIGELNDTKALFVADDRAPDVTDFVNVTTLRAFLATQASGWLIEMLSANRFTTWFQPIVRLDDPGVVFGNEALFRGTDANGEQVPATRVFETGREAGLLFQLDLMARRSAIAQAAATQAAGKLYVNFNPASIYDPAYCLRSTMKAIDEVGIAHDRLAFEVVESERALDRDRLSMLLEHYRQRGFGVGLDDVGAGQASLSTMAMLRPDYVKVDRSLVHGVDLDAGKAMVLAKVFELAKELGIDAIAKGVETQGELAWLRAQGCVYAQGFLLGRPAPLPVIA
jgi:EAL domain-containing protein (putative c-di-GMP-specific phosphodiesterase class I)